MRGTAGRALLVALVVVGCRQDMHDAPRYDPLEKSAFFDDRRASRPFVEGTVARGELREDAHLYQGRANGRQAETFPFRVTRAVLDRGQERYEIHCGPCHGLVGDGLGMIVERGFHKPSSFHIDRLREATPGYFFEVITNGFGVMEDYAAQVSPRDRWAIIAYIRALQLSRSATLADVPEEHRAKLRGGRDR